MAKMFVGAGGPEITRLDAGEHVRRNLRIKITLPRLFGFRLFLAATLLRLVARISPVVVEIVHSDGGEAEGIYVSGADCFDPRVNVTPRWPSV